MNLKAKSVAGAKWAAISQVATQASQLYIGITLARLLDPNDFGLLGMVLVFSRFAQVLADMGIGAAIVQRSTIEPKELNSAFWFNAAAGALLCASLFLAAPLIANFYSTPALTPLARWIAATFLISAFTIVPTSLMVKDFRFRDLAIVETCSFLTAGVAAIVAAWNGMGVWSLVIQSLVLVAVKLVVTFALSSWSPRFEFEWNAVKRLFPFSMNLTGAQLINYWIRNADNLLIGKYLGQGDLGLYTRAYSFMLMPVRQISTVVTRVMFPAFSAIQDDIPRIRAIYLRTLSVIALMTFPIGMGLMSVADYFVLGLLGEKWAGMIPILQILCVLAVTQSLGSTAGVIYQSLGRTDLQFRWSIYSGVIYLTAFVIGLQFGVIGVAAAYMIASVVFMTIPNALIIGHLTGIKLREFGAAVSGVFACALTMAISVYGLGRTLDGRLEKHWTLFILVLTGAALYFALIYCFRIGAVQEVRQLVASKLKSNTTSKSDAKNPESAPLDQVPSKSSR